MQDDLNNRYLVPRSGKMLFNVEKCKVMNSGRKKMQVIGSATLGILHRNVVSPLRQGQGTRQESPTTICTHDAWS